MRFNLITHQNLISAVNVYKYKLAFRIIESFQSGSIACTKFFGVIFEKCETISKVDRDVAQIPINY